MSHGPERQMSWPELLPQYSPAALSQSSFLVQGVAGDGGADGGGEAGRAHAKGLVSVACAQPRHGQRAPSPMHVSTNG